MYYRQFEDKGFCERVVEDGGRVRLVYAAELKADRDARMKKASQARRDSQRLRSDLQKAGANAAFLTRVGNERKAKADRAASRKVAA
jgi:hypothetical protein